MRALRRSRVREFVRRSHPRQAMSRREDEDYEHGSAPLTAVVLFNLGTPSAPTTPAVRRYLREFLADPRVVEVPRALWLPLLHGIIVPFRAPRTAAKYARIWQPAGSPLASATASLERALQSELERRGHHLTVRHAMRYGEPATAAVLDVLHREGMTRMLGVALYPQYSAATTATALDAVGDWLRGKRRQPALRWVRSFADHPSYIAALACSVRSHWASHGRPDRLVMSFHGMPRRTLELGDPYHCECRKTARLLAQALELDDTQYLVSFQSRFGAEAWLQPYTEPSLRELARAGVRRVDVVCPGFVADCLETLEEIAIEGKQAFLSSGGAEFHYIACLNDSPQWVAGLADLVESELLGWPTRQAADAGQLAASAARAQALREAAR